MKKKRDAMLYFRERCRLAIKSFCLLCLFGLMLSGNVSAQENAVTLNQEGISVKQVLIEIERQTKIAFVYSPKDVNPLKPVNVNFTKAKVDNILNFCLKGTNLIWDRHGNTITIRVGQQLKKNLILVTGKVTDRDSLSLPGVTVRLKESMIGTTTDVKGNFRMFVPGESTKIILVFSSIGMKQVTKEVKVGKPVIVIMEEDITSLDAVDVISTGYYKVDKRHLTSAVTSIKADDILVPGLSTIDQMLEGHVPGMIFMQNSGQVGAAPKIKIRGTTTLLGNTSPLWVLDGVILSDPVNVDASQINDLDFVNLLGNAISGLNPEDIEQIDVLKDASATAIYGPRASNGVIVISTKKGKVGKPAVTYSVSGTFRQRPRYTDRTVNVMNSRERVGYSRDLVEAKQAIGGSDVEVGYEYLYNQFLTGKITRDEFQEGVAYVESVNTDWLDILMKDTFSNKHTLSISGGSENMRYYSSVGLMDEAGNIRGEENKRYSAMLNLNLNYNKFTMQFGLNGNVQKKEYTPSKVDVMNYAFNTSRAIPAYEENGDMWFYQKRDGGPGSYNVDFNILNEMQNSYNKINTNSMTLNATLGYRVLPCVTAQMTFAYSISDSKDETWYGEKSHYILKKKCEFVNMYDPAKNGTVNNYATTCPVGGEISMKNTQNENYSIRANITYNSYLDEAQHHQVSASLIGELSSSEYNGFSITRRGFVRDRGMNFADIPFDASKMTAYATWLRTPEARGMVTDNLTNQVGLVATASYVYKNEYILNGNMRIDASNKFGDKSNEKLLPIWSLSGRWNMHERLLKSANWVNVLALKMSFGYQGNMSESESPKLVILPKPLHPFFNQDYATIEKFPNPSLGWEKTSTMNMDLEFAFFKSKLRGSVGYYYRHTTNAFMPKEVSASNGVTSYTVNGGELKNHGIEWTLDFTPINTMINKVGEMGTGGVSRKGFVWRFNPNFGTVINQLIDKAKPKDKVLVDDDKITYEKYLTGDVYVSGRPVNSFYSYKFKGLDPATGAPMFYDIEGERGAEFDNMTKDEMLRSVMTRSGPREPFLQGGVNNYFGFGNFALTFNFSYSIGSKIRLFKLYPGGGAASAPTVNLRRELTDRWQRPGDEAFTDVPAILSGDALRAANGIGKVRSPKGIEYKFANNAYQMYDDSDLRVVSGDYLKIKDVSFRYVLPDAFCRRIYLKSAYVSVSAANIYTFCNHKLKGQDPMQSGSSELISMSLRPTYTLQFNITF